MEMKKQLLGAMLLLQTLFSLGQNTVVVANEKMNVVYIGMDNPLKIAAPVGATVTAVGANLTGSGSLYNLIVTKVGLVKIIITSPNGTIEEFPLQARNSDHLPKPKFFIGTSGNITLAELQKIDGVLIDLGDFDWGCEVIGYEFTVVKKGGDILSGVNLGREFNPMMLKFIQQVRSGDTIYIDNIKDQCPWDRAGFFIPPMVWKVL
jgi:hypothetical protein